MSQAMYSEFFSQLIRRVDGGELKGNQRKAAELAALLIEEFLICNGDGDDFVSTTLALLEEVETGEEAE